MLLLQPWPLSIHSGSCSAYPPPFLPSRLPSTRVRGRTQNLTHAKLILWMPSMFRLSQSSQELSQSGLSSGRRLAQCSALGGRGRRILSLRPTWSTQRNPALQKQKVKLNLKINNKKTHQNEKMTVTMNMRIKLQEHWKRSLKPQISTSDSPPPPQGIF